MNEFYIIVINDILLNTFIVLIMGKVLFIFYLVKTVNNFTQGDGYFHTLKI